MKEKVTNLRPGELGFGSLNQRDNSADQRCGERSSTHSGDTATGDRPNDVLPWCGDAVAGISASVVAEIHRIAVGIYCTHREGSRRCRRDVQTLAPVVARSSNQQHTGLGTSLHRVIKPLVGNPGIGVLAAGEVDDVGAFADRDLDCSGDL